MSAVGLTIEKLRAMQRMMTQQLEAPETIEVTSIDEFRALPDRERAVRTIEWLKRMGRFTIGMAPREMEDHEIIAALLIGNGEITR